MRGITVTLYKQTVTGYDSFGAPVYKETAVSVDNVLVAPTSASENLDIVNLYGRTAVYTLAIPKGDTNTWENCRVNFFGRDWRVFGIPLEGIDDLIPLGWNKKVTVEVYE